MSIRLRLTLLYSLILALTLIAFSTILYVAQANLTLDNIRANLMRQAAGIAHSGGHFGPPPGGPPGDGGRPGGAPDVSRAGDVLPGRWTQTRSLTGTVIARTFDLSSANLPLSSAGLHAVQSGSGWFETAPVQGESLLIYSQPFTNQSGMAEIVQIGFPITQPLQSLNTLRLILVIGSGLAIMAAFAIGWLLAGTALRPIHRITHTAQVIGAEHDFSRRVEHMGPADEIGQLAHTFNDMLAELESAYRQLQVALESQRRFVADASHELSTPLTTVRGNMELLRRVPPIDELEATEVLADTCEEVERLIRLVNQLLVLARADAGQKPRREPVPLDPLMEDVCRQGKLMARHCTLVCKLAPDVQVLGDRDSLKQVFLILVDNAVVHTAPGTVIKVESALVQDRAVITVHDTGPGIAPDVLPHIFERFYRGDVSRTGTGTGLGLAIAKELVEAQGGTIGVASQVGQGSVFTVSLPGRAA